MAALMTAPPSFSAKANRSVVPPAKSMRVGVRLRSAMVHLSRSVSVAEPNLQDIAVFDDIVRPLQRPLTVIAACGDGPVFYEGFGGDDLCPDEMLSHIGVNFRRRLLCIGALRDGPAARFFLRG